MKYKQGTTCRRGTVPVTHKGRKKGKPKMLTPKEFEDKSIEYFQMCKDDGLKVTISGLAYHLGFKSVQSVHDYRKDPDYDRAVGRAYLYVEKLTEEDLLAGNAPPAAGIFTLKARFGLVDKQEVQYSEKVTDSGGNEW